ncbi:hypothetical protein QJP72_24620 (plasmid) [Escherichia coli]|nr:hypothetical protein [Escherichia coli]WHC57830.1 hypothetical protein QJP72_24620 [Escherichia coli]
MLSCLPGAPSAPGCLAASGRQARLRQAAAGAPASLRRTRWRGFGLSLPVRCVKTLACSDRSGRAASVAPWPALWHPGKRPPGCKGQRRFANRASRRCGGSLPVVLSGAIHLFKPLSPGVKTATTVSASPG